MKISIVIPSINRPESLQRAIEGAVAAMAAAPGVASELIVVTRPHDDATRALAERLGAQVGLVDRPGLAAALRAGAEAADGDVVAFTDDDAVPRADWISRMSAHYSDPRVGGVGGRDQQPSGYPTRIRQEDVGQIDRLGRVLGGHHVATGEARDVAHLKGVNSSFRTALFLRVPFQSRVAGTGSQARNEFIASLAVTAQGYRLVFDPELVVDHYPAERGEGDERQDRSKIEEAAFNEAFGFALAAHPRRHINTVFTACVGYNNTPGVVRLLRGARPGDVGVAVAAARAGRRAGRDQRRAELS